MAYPASACRLYRSTHTPSLTWALMKVKPLGVRQSAPLALPLIIPLVLTSYQLHHESINSLHSSHFTLSKSLHGKFDNVFSPDPNGTPPLVGVLCG